MIPQGAFTRDAANALLAGDPLLHALATDTAVNCSILGRRLITRAAALALIGSAPVSGADDLKLIQIVSLTAFAHTFTATGLLQTGSASVNAATFAAFAGAGLTVMCFQGKLVVLYSNGITFS